MNAILDFLRSSTWAQTLANKAIRHAATLAGGAILALAVNHGVAGNTAQDLSGEIGGLVLTLGGLALSYFDAKTVDAKIKIAAATGSTDSDLLNAQALAAAKSAS